MTFLAALTLLAVPATLGYINLRSASRNGSAVRINSGAFSLVVPRKQFFRRALRASASLSSKPIQAFDLPAFAVEFAIDRATGSFPSTWTPRGIDFLTWRALVFPFYSLPVWWFVGIGSDALLRRRRLPWPVLLLGTSLCAGFIFLFCGLTIGLSREDRIKIMYPLWGFGLWCVLFAVFPAAWLLRRKDAGGGTAA